MPSLLVAFDAEAVRYASRLGHRRAKGMTITPSDDIVARENVYLHNRVAQLQGNVTAIPAEAERLRQIVERLHGRGAQRAPNPLGGGQ